MYVPDLDEIRDMMLLERGDFKDSDYSEWTVERTQFGHDVIEFIYQHFDVTPRSDEAKDVIKQLGAI